MLSALMDRARVVEPEPAQGTGLRVVPIQGPSHAEPPYRLLGPETAGRVSVTEVSETGSVPHLRVTNELDVRVLLLDGQELVGAKQNRILNTDVLVPAGASLTIPVSCVEQGRWRSISPQFSPGKSASYRTRQAKMQRVHQSLKERKAHDADQSAVWREVEESLFESDAGGSPTRALADAYARREREMDAFRSSLTLPERTVGVAIFHGRSFRGLDLFDRHETLRSFWATLLDSYAIDFLGTPLDLAAPPTGEQAEGRDPAASAEHAQVRSLLTAAAESSEWEAFDSPGEGADWRLSAATMNGSALVWEGRVLLHLQLFPTDTDGLRGLRLRRGVARPRRAADPLA